MARAIQQEQRFEQFLETSRVISLTLYENDGVTPIVLTGMTMIYTHRKETKDSAYLLRKSSANAGEIDIVVAASGTFTITIDQADTTATTDSGDYDHVLMYTPSGGEREAVMWGKYIWKKSAFKSTDT